MLKYSCKCWSKHCINVKVQPIPMGSNVFLFFFYHEWNIVWMLNIKIEQDNELIRWYQLCQNQ